MQVYDGVLNLLAFYYWITGRKVRILTQKAVLAVEVYDSVLKVFPTSGKTWLSYANTFVAENKKAQAIQVLQRALGTQFTRVTGIKVHMMLCNAKRKGAGDPSAAARASQFTRVTGIQVQILTQKALRQITAPVRRPLAGIPHTRCTRFTGTKVQILTQKALR